MVWAKSREIHKFVYEKTFVVKITMQTFKISRLSMILFFPTGRTVQFLSYFRTRRFAMLLGRWRLLKR